MVYYFSATGNTRHVAMLLAKELGDSVQSVTQTGEAEAVAQHGVQTDGRGENLRPCVLCFPVHGWRVPKIVESSLKHLCRTGHIRKGTLLYVVLTCGDDCGETIKYLRKSTDPLGIEISGAFSLVMPESYVGLPFMDVDSKEREQEKIRTAEKVIPHIADTILSKKTGIYEVKEGGCAYLKSKVIGAFFHKVLITDKTFRLDTAACIGCGKCAKACPVGNLEMRETIPHWLHNGDCLTCLACYHVCPKHAIAFNWQTKHKGQYNTLI